MGAGRGSRLFGRDIECVCGRGVCVCERELVTERHRERKRGGVCVHKWRIDRETMLMLSEIVL